MTTEDASVYEVGRYHLVSSDSHSRAQTQPSRPALYQFYSRSLTATRSATESPGSFRVATPDVELKPTERRETHFIPSEHRPVLFHTGHHLLLQYRAFNPSEHNNVEQVFCPFSARSMLEETGDIPPLPDGWLRRNDDSVTKFSARYRAGEWSRIRRALRAPWKTKVIA